VIEASDLGDEPFISLSHHDGMRERVDAIFQDSHIKRSMLVETEFFATVCCMVVNGIGVSVVNPLVAKDFIGQGLVLKPLVPCVQFPVYLLSPSHRPASILAQRFQDIVRELLAEDVRALTPQAPLKTG